MNKALQYVKPTKYRIWYTEIDEICAKIGSIHYAGDERFRSKHYDPIPLPLWEVPLPKPKTQPQTPQTPIINRPRGQKRPNPYQPQIPRSKR